jgi:UDP-N-acetylmuramoylalanine--D-glutamate ligase
MQQANAIMTTASDRQQAYTLVVGLGMTGLSVVKYLRGLGELVVVADSRVHPPRLSECHLAFPEVETHCGAFDTELFKQAHRIVLSPGVPLNTSAVQEAKQAGIEITGDIDLFAHEAAAPVIGITGSNGKSTVTALLNAMAVRAGVRVAMGGNIGTPILDLLDDANQLYVIELSSFQLETMRELQLEAGVVLNISDDHMDRYTDFAGYAQSKHILYQHTRNWVVNRDDAIASTPPFLAAHVTGFTLSQPAQNDFGLCVVNGDDWLCFGNENLLPVSEMKIRGRHNVANALAALALGQYAGLDMSAMLDTLREFTGLPHRTQWVAAQNGVNWYNDSKATNVGAALAAIYGLPGEHVLIAGGEGKGADFSALRAAASRLRAVVLIGRDADIIAAALGDSVAQVRAVDMKQAVQCAAELAVPGDNVLLSPACASFDMFNNFEHRGEVFIREVQALLA